MIRRGEVWISPEGYVPPGRMVDPEAAEFMVSWQDDDSLQDDVVHGATPAVEWGRERAEVVMIRLGHSEGTYFSAGERHPADSEEDPVPHWPPAGPPPEGWWYPPPLPTLADATEVRERMARGELETAAARAWAEERIALFAAELGEKDLPTLEALVDVRGDSSPRRGAFAAPESSSVPRGRPGWKELRDHWAQDAGTRVDIWVADTTDADWERAFDYLIPPWSGRYTEDSEPADRPVASEIFRRGATRACTLEIELTPLSALSAHFLTRDEIEFDLDPQALLNHADVAELYRFVRVLGRGLGRTVHVGTTAEHRRRQETLRYEPESDRFVSRL